jgi:hypothetical protein
MGALLIKLNLNAQYNFQTHFHANEFQRKRKAKMIRRPAHHGKAKGIKNGGRLQRQRKRGRTLLRPLQEQLKFSGNFRSSQFAHGSLRFVPHNGIKITRPRFLACHQMWLQGQTGIYPSQTHLFLRGKANELH